MNKACPRRIRGPMLDCVGDGALTVDSRRFFTGGGVTALRGASTSHPSSTRCRERGRQGEFLVELAPLAAIGHCQSTRGLARVCLTPREAAPGAGGHRSRSRVCAPSCQACQSGSPDRQSPKDRLVGASRGIRSQAPAGSESARSAAVPRTNPHAAPLAGAAATAASAVAVAVAGPVAVARPQPHSLPLAGAVSPWLRFTALCSPNPKLPSCASATAIYRTALSVKGEW